MKSLQSNLRQVEELQDTAYDLFIKGDEQAKRLHYNLLALEERLPQMNQYSAEREISHCREELEEILEGYKGQEIPKGRDTIPCIMQFED